VIGTRRITERGELARLDFNFGDGAVGPVLKYVVVLLTRSAALPNLKRLGKIVVRETAEGLVNSPERLLRLQFLTLGDLPCAAVSALISRFRRRAWSRRCEVQPH